MSDEQMNNDSKDVQNEANEKKEQDGGYEKVESEFYQEDDFGFDGDEENEPAEENKPREEAPARAPEQSEVPENTEKDKKKKEYRVLIKNILAGAGIGLGIIVVIAGIAMTALLINTPKDAVCEGIYVNNLNLGGLDYELAKASVESSYVYENNEITLESGEKSFSIKSADIDMEAVAGKTVDRAMAYGKTGNKLKDAWDVLVLKLKGKLVLKPIPEVNEEKLDAKLNEFGVMVCGELKGHRIEYKEGAETPTLIAVPGVSGYDGNPEKARQQVLDALANDRTENIHVDFGIGHPHDLTVEELGNTVYKDPVDAGYKMQDGQIITTPEADGRYIKPEECEALVVKVKEGGEKIEMPYHISKAQNNQAVLKEKLFSSTVGSYSTRFGAGGNRGQNVALAARKINGAVVMPGETFSFNQRVGKRTAANGFKTAPEYREGQTVEGIGGGTCQVSTTLYSAVLYANLEIVSRSNHSMAVSYVPLGQDATVSDGGVDFKFRNNTQYPVKISAGTNGGTLSVSIIGTAANPPVKVSLNHASVSSGAIRVIKTTRTVKNASTGEVIKSENMGRSTYKPHA